MKIFERYKEGKFDLRNRLVIPPMCMYSTKGDGMANDFHLAHYGSYAIGGFGLITIEATGVLPEGRISKYDIGLWDDNQVEPLKRIIDLCHDFGAKVSIQLAHAGRKNESEEVIYAPSPIRHSEDYKIPKEMSKEDIKLAIDAFKSAAKRAIDAGVDIIEIHAAHGYLIHEFLSPLSNKRTDEYGGDTRARVKFLEEVIAACKSVMREDMPLIIRVSATDWSDGGIDVDEMVKIVDMIKDSVDMIHVSTGGLIHNAKIKAFKGFQVKFSEEIRKRCNVKTIAVGLIDKAYMAEKIVENNSADLVAIGRAALRDPNWPLNESEEDSLIPAQYKRGYR